jgi:hypothetical protein
MLDRIIADTSRKGNLQKVSEKTFTQFEIHNSSSLPEELKKANQRIQQLEKQVEIIPKIQKLLQEERQKTQQLEQALKQEQDTKWQERNLWKRKEIKPAQKAALISIQRQIDHPTQKDEEGYTRICFETTAAHMGMSSSTAKRAIDAIQEQCPDLPMKTKTVEECTEDGKRIPRLYILPEKNLIQAIATIEIPEENIHKQGGNRYQCQNPVCLSHNVMVKRRLVCLDCGHEIDLEPTYPNGKLKNSTGKTSRNNLLLTDMHVSHPSKHESDAKNFDGPVQLDDVVLKPDTPPIAEQFADDAPIVDPLIRTKAAQLLVDIAGDSPIHIGMNRRGENKYRTIKGRLFLEEALEHLQGKETYGAFCSRSDGKTRSLCWDVDTMEEWKILEIHARALAAVGYLPILESSPAGRGGHLWIIFDTLVDAITARFTVCTLVPELAEVKEYWPAPEHGKGNRVRLPGGRYTAYGKNEWCQLISVADGEHSTNGDESAQLLLTHQTPASILPSPDPNAGSELYTAQVEQSQVEQTPASDQEPIGLSGIDARWEQQYGQTPEGKRLWFAWTDEYLIARYNAMTNPEDLIDINREGKALASWRGEKTASVAPWRGDRWTDFGASAQRPAGAGTNF